jgi:hypothetical protein
MVKRRVAFKTHAIWVECGLVQYENKVETTEGIHLLNLQGENSFKVVQKPSQKDHLLINVTCVGTLT